MGGEHAPLVGGDRAARRAAKIVGLPEPLAAHAVDGVNRAADVGCEDRVPKSRRAACDARSGVVSPSAFARRGVQSVQIAIVRPDEDRAEIDNAGGRLSNRRSGRASELRRAWEWAWELGLGLWWAWLLACG